MLGSEELHYKLMELTSGIFTKSAEEQSKVLEELFGENGPLKGMKDDFIIEEYPPLISEQDDRFSNSITISFKMRYKIREKTDEEKQASSSQ